MNLFLPAPFEEKKREREREKKKHLSVMSYACARAILYTSSILVKIMHLSQLFFLMLTLKALT